MRLPEKYFYNLNIAMEAVLENRFRSMLTALGIIFGVAAVIAMMAIGTGARQEILEQMKLVGVNNIVVRHIFVEEDQQMELLQGRFSPGLTLEDARSIHEIIPSVRHVSPEVEFSTYAFYEGIRRTVRAAGVTPAFFEVFGLQIFRGGMFSKLQQQDAASVCIIGNNVRAALFGNEDPIGRQIKVGTNWLTVIGVVEDRLVPDTALEDFGISEFNNVVYIPVQTALLRFQDRSAVTANDLRQARSRNRSMRTQASSNGNQETSTNYHQLDRIVVQVHESSSLTTTSELLMRMLRRRHNGVEDFEVIVPELLLQQEQRTKDIFNIVLGAIAGISLVVGGIGIMNIMLASVMQRTREIGIRMAVGAKKTDVVFQFLSESTIISVGGGIIGIFLGLALSRGIMHFTDILTIVSPFSIVVSFGVAATVGIAFGYMPAKQASEKDPVNALRYE